MKLISPSEEYLEQAKRLSSEETERLLASMRRRFSRRTEDKNLSMIEVLALQLEHEMEDLAKWRERMAELKQLQEGADITAGSGQ